MVWKKGETLYERAATSMHDLASRDGVLMDSPQRMHRDRGGF